jgi:hypothetical protein
MQKLKTLARTLLKMQDVVELNHRKGYKHG